MTSEGSNGIPSVVGRFLQESRAVALVRADPKGRIIQANRGLGRIMRCSPQDLQGRPLAELFSEGDRDRVAQLLEGPTQEAHLLHLMVEEGHIVSLEWLAQVGPGGATLVGERLGADEEWVGEELMLLNNELSVVSRERARQKRKSDRLAAELQEALAKLEESHWHLAKIHDVLSVCMECGRVRTAEGRWDEFVQYLIDSQVLVSHGYCPPCGADALARIPNPESAGGP